MSGKKKLATKADYANTEFQPWPVVENSGPTNEAWFAHVIAVRLAEAVMTKTKAELVDAFVDRGAVMMDAHEEFQQSAKVLKAALTILQSADLRLLVAGCAAEAKSAA